jgi:hypothetical protein
VNGDAIAVARAQALAQWMPERRDAAALQLMRDLAGPGAAANPALDAATAVQPQAGPTSGTTLATLLSVLPPRTEPCLDSAVETALGTTAKLVSRLAAAAPAGDAPLTPITTAAPLSPEPGNAIRIAAGLRQAIGASGLFYESHLAGWVEGTGTQSGLQREPQAAFAPATTHDPGHAQGLAPQAEGMIQRQLEVLEHRAAHWQGQAWPGQRAEVRIAEDDAGARQDATGATAWQASLRVSMPGLGDVEARVGLSGSNARLAIGTADPGSARTLANARGDLARALGEQGLALAEVRVEHGDPAQSR